MKWWYENEEEMKSCEHCSHEDCKNIGGTWYCLDCPECGVNWEKKMEFDKGRIYSAVNADELKQGDKVIVGDTIMELRDFIEEKAGAMKCYALIKEILPENREKRFALDDNMRYALAYLVERKENCTNCEEAGKEGGCRRHGEIDKILCCDCYTPKTEKSCTKCQIATKLSDGTLACDVDGFPVDCTPPHDEACSDYEPKTEPKTVPHYRPFRDTDELIKVWCDKGGKWQKRELTMPHIWVKYKGDDTDRGRLIISYSNNGCSVIDVDEIKVMLWEGLFEKCVFLDGSPCGVEE